MLRVRWGAALVVLAAVTACGEVEPGAASLPPVSAAPSVAASVPASPSAAPVPSAAQAATPQGAAEFARFFYAEVERAYAETDPAIIERLSAPGCQACEHFIRTLKITRDAGERYEGLTHELLLVEAPAATGPTVAVTVVYNAPSVTLQAADGSVMAREAAVHNHEQQVDLLRSDQSWLVQEVRSM